jgi:solute carrier family 25 phosphate transporter 3
MPEVYKGIGTGFKIASSEGALTLGWLPTLIGYSAQGAFKFGFYEIFKVRACAARSPPSPPCC